MKNYKQILEAINRGIKLSLDDFEDEPIQDQDPVLSKRKILNYDSSDDYVENIIMPTIFNHVENISLYVTILNTGNISSIEDLKDLVLDNLDKELLFNYIKRHNLINQEDYVDLDLPSRTLWCKKNLGAPSCNAIGSTYSWGMLKPGMLYNSIQIKATYLDELKTNKKISIQIDKEDDIAYLANSHYRTPTLELFNELYSNTYNLRLENQNAIILISLKNPFHFIAFPINKTSNNILYITSEIFNYNKSNNSNKLERGIFINCIKFTQFNNFKLISFKSWDGETIPPTESHVRPIYIK